MLDGVGTVKIDKEDIKIECHDGPVPDWAETELNRLYGNIYSSLLHFRLHGGLNGASTYVARRNGEVRALFLYKVNGEQVHVLNEGMILPAQEIERFTATMFERFSSVDVIEFHAVHTQMAKSSWPFQQFYQTEDFVLQLPDSADAYLAMLGSATRKNVKKHLSRWQREFPGSEIRVVEKEQIEEQQLREVVVFNRMRMAAKNQVSSLDDAEVLNLLRMAKQCGMLCLTLVKGRIVAGTLLFRFGDNFVSRVNAHDSGYDDYRLGTLSCYWAICECIRRGGSEFHFMSGRYAYKTALGGVLYEMAHIAIYRSYWHLLRHLRLATLTACHGYRKEAKIWLLGQEKANGPMSRLTQACLNALRVLKRVKQGRMAG